MSRTFGVGSNFLHSIKDYHFLSKSRACFPRPVSLPLSRFLSVYLAVIHCSMYSSTHTHHTRQRGSLLLCAQQTRTITFFGWDIIIIIITIITRRCIVGESCKRARTHIYTSEAHTQARELAKQPLSSSSSSTSTPAAYHQCQSALCVLSSSR